MLWLRVCHNPARDRHRPDAPAPGAVNPRTGKTSLRVGYAPATINHAVSVMSAFYEFHLLSGQGPVVSPVPPQSRGGLRLQGHHNPLEPFRLHRRGAYRQKQPEAMPRAVPDAVVEDLFGALDCNRDRALFAMFLSSGARAGELLGMTVGDAHPGDGRIYVRSKGLGGAKQACPASPEAFAWLALYLGELAQEGKRPGAGRAAVVDQAQSVAPVDLHRVAGGVEPDQRPDRHGCHAARSATHAVSTVDRGPEYQPGGCSAGDAAPVDHHDQRIPASPGR